MADQQYKNYFTQLKEAQTSNDSPFIEQIITNSTNKLFKNIQSSKLKISETPKCQPNLLQDQLMHLTTSTSNAESTQGKKIYKSLNQLSKERRNREERMNEQATRLMQQIKIKEEEFQEKQKKGKLFIIIVFKEKQMLHKQLHDQLQQKVHKLSQDTNNRLQQLEKEKKTKSKPKLPLYRQKLKKFAEQEKTLIKQKEQALQTKLEKLKLYDVQKVKTFQEEYDKTKNSYSKGRKKNSFHYTPPKNRSHFYDVFAQEIIKEHNKTQSPNQSAIKYDPGKQIILKLDPEKKKEMQERLMKLEIPVKEQIFPLMAHQNTYDFRAYQIKPKLKKELNNQIYERAVKKNNEVYEMGKNYLSDARKVIKSIKSEGSEQTAQEKSFENPNPNANYQKQLYQLGKEYLNHQSKLISQKTKEEHQYTEWEQILNNPNLTEQQKKEEIQICIKKLEEQVSRKEKVKKAKGGQISLKANDNQEIDKLLLTSIRAKLAML